MSIPNISNIFSDFTNAVVGTNTIVSKLKQELQDLEDDCKGADKSGGVFNKSGAPNGSDLVNDYLSLVATLHPAAGTPAAAQLAALQQCPAFASLFKSATAVATKVGNFGGGTEHFSYDDGQTVEGVTLKDLANNYNNPNYIIEGGITANYLVNFSDFTVNGADFSGAANSIASILSKL